MRDEVAHVCSGGDDLFLDGGAVVVQLERLIRLVGMP
jgi:hypothetical protein